MKRHGSSDSLGALMSICRGSDANSSPRGSGVAAVAYGRDIQSMLEGLDDEGCSEEIAAGGPSEKKRRLSVQQVKSLEKNFEVENKLEPERKVKLAQELGLQPRQVAVWFQNRRARWKTKQLERDFGVLKANYDSLKISCNSLKRDNNALLKEIKELKSKLNEENSNQSNPSGLKDDAAAAGSESENTKLLGKTKPSPVFMPSLDPKEPNLSSDCDSSAILNDENATSSSPGNAAISSSGAGVLQAQQLNLMLYQPHFVKMEEQSFVGDEACNFFSDEQAPTLHWYCPDQWN